MDVIMPKMGDAMTEGKVLKWHKRPGEQVRQGEPIAEIETDKVNVDIEAEETGTLLDVVVNEGQTAAVGAKIATIGKAGEKPAARPAASPAAQPDGDKKKPAPAEPVLTKPEPRESHERLKATPIARRLAEEHGIDLAQVTGTGPEGRITKEDIEGLIASGTAPAATRPPSAPTPVTAGPEYEDVPPSRMRQTIARRMMESKQQAPHFYVTVEVAMDDALRARQQLNAAVGETRKVSVNDFVIRAAALALRSFPNINSGYVDGKFRRYRRIHVANAIALPPPARRVRGWDFYGEQPRHVRRRELYCDHQPAARRDSRGGQCGASCCSPQRSNRSVERDETYALCGSSGDRWSGGGEVPRGS